jgi:DNA-binding transcriptional regulator YdaS (Cro superfamily)
MAKALGNVSSQAVSQWKRVPADRVLEVERISGVSRHDLRPDLYPREDETRPVATGEDEA